MTRSKNLPKTGDGRKCYPCCGFQRNQHKILYWEDKAALDWYDTESDEAYEEWQKWQDIWAMACTFIIDDVMYFPYPEYNIVKEAVVAYDLCH